MSSWGGIDWTPSYFKQCPLRQLEHPETATNQIKWYQDSSKRIPTVAFVTSSYPHHCSLDRVCRNPSYPLLLLSDLIHRNLANVAKFSFFDFCRYFVCSGFCFAGIWGSLGLIEWIEWPNGKGHKSTGSGLSVKGSFSGAQGREQIAMNFAHRWTSQAEKVNKSNEVGESIGSQSAKSFLFGSLVAFYCIQ